MSLEKEINFIKDYKTFLTEVENIEYKNKFLDLLEEYEYLYKKYSTSIEITKNFIDISMQEYKEHKEYKQHKNENIMNYKKRSYEELKKLKIELFKDEETIQSYRKKIKELSNENLVLKHKFRHLSSTFQHKKENELIHKYFPHKEVIEQGIEKSVTKALKEKLNLNNISHTYFLKYYLTAIKDYLAKWARKKVPAEKLSILISSIIIKDFSLLIHIIISKFILNKISTGNENYINFLINITRNDLLEEKTSTIFKKIEIKNDNNKTISSEEVLFLIDKFKKIDVEENNIHDLSIKLEVEELEKEKLSLSLTIEELEIESSDISIDENNILLEISQTQDEEELCELKSKLSNIDDKKRENQSEKSKITHKISNIINKINFLIPIIEETDKKFNNMDEKNKNIKKSYDNLVIYFASALENQKN